MENLCPQQTASAAHWIRQISRPAIQIPKTYNMERNVGPMVHRKRQEDIRYPDEIVNLGQLPHQLPYIRIQQ